MKYTEEQVSEAMEGSPALWTIKHKIKNETGLPIEFSKRKFLFQIYNDLSPLQVLLKPPQIGATVCNTIKTFYVAKKLGRQIIYTLPTQGDVQDMVGGAINRIIAQNGILSEWVKDHDTVEQKQVGNSMIFYRGTFTAKQAMMIPSGLNIHDEVDASDMNVITQYENRLQAQEDGGWRWYFSHPSLTGRGVDVYWQQSDKKEWFITCPHCQEEQFMTFPDNIDFDKEIYICSHCKKELSNETRINGVWKPTAEGEFSGYHVSQLMLYNKTASDILKAYRDPLKDRQFFYNYVLGLPYASSEDKIEPATVLKNCVDKVNSQEGMMVIGADTGHGIHYVLMNNEGVFYYDHETDITAAKDPYDKIRWYFTARDNRGKLRFPKCIAVFDQGGDLIGVRKLQAEFPGRVFLCFYRKDRKSLDLIKWGKDEEYGTVVVDRNRMITLIIEQMKDIGRIRLNGTPEEWKDFASHFGNIYREKITSKETPEKDNSELYGSGYVWKRNGPDHFCFVAGTKIITNQGEIPIENINVGDRVFTRKGFKEVISISNRISPVVRIKDFEVTLDHPFWTQEGFKPLHSILYSDMITICQNKSFIKILSSVDILIQRIERKGYTMFQAGQCDQKESVGCTKKYTEIILVKFLRALSSIIKTVILLTMKREIWRQFLEKNTRETTLESGLKTIRRRIGLIWTSSGKRATNGEELMREKNGTENTLLNQSFFRQENSSVSNAMESGSQEAQKEASFVQKDARQDGIQENGELITQATEGDLERKRVYNIEVADAHEYFANGILVSNCHSLLYAIVGLQKFGNDQAKIVGSDVWAGTPKGRIVEPQQEQSFVGLSPDNVRSGQVVL